jgi:uncharacterized glyoxalase superfamily protein PhnB
VPENQWHAGEPLLAEAPRTAFRLALRQALERRIAMAKIEAPPAISTVTPFVAVVDVGRLVVFARDTFGAQELGRRTVSDGGVQVLIGIGDSRLVFAGGSQVAGRETPAALHVYVPDIDATYRRALGAGAISVHPPTDKPYGARDATVKDPAGSLWFIATRHPGVAPPVRLRTVTPWLIAPDALGLIAFLKQAFNAAEVGVHTTPDGRLLHGALSIGDSVVEFGEAEGVPPAAFYLVVPDAEALRERALGAGATPLSDLAYRADVPGSIGVKDPWGNAWHIRSEAPFS